MNEYAIIVYMVSAGTLFAVGGTWKKLVRRFGLPIATAVFLAFLPIPIWKVLLSSGLLCVALHLGYGETKPYWYKGLVAVAYVLPSLVLGFTVWQVITPLVFVGMFYFSNHYFKADFPWKVVEFITGVCIAVTFITAI